MALSPRSKTYLNALFEWAIQEGKKGQQQWAVATGLHRVGREVAERSYQAEQEPLDYVVLAVMQEGAKWYGEDERMEQLRHIANSMEPTAITGTMALAIAQSPQSGERHIIQMLEQCNIMHARGRSAGEMWAFAYALTQRAEDELQHHIWALGVLLLGRAALR